MKNSENCAKAQATHRESLKLSLATIAIATLFGSAPALAEPLFQNSIMPRPDNSRWTDNYLELGVGGVKTNAPNGKAFKFGEFTGLNDDDPFAIVGFNWIFRSKEDDARYFRTHASDLAMDTRKFSVEGGKQGAWDLSFSAEQLLRAEISPAQFVHNGLGSSILTNPAGAATARNDPGFLKFFDIEQSRDIYRLGARGVLGAHWDLKVNYREDNRDGNRLTGVVFSTGANNAAIVPYEINDKTQQLDLTLGYLSKVIEGQLSYSYSRYENTLDRFRVENYTGNTNPTAQLSLAPDNEYHQVTATGVYKISKDTRAKAQLSYGVALQNETFLPYNSAGAGITSGTLLPRSSLEAEVINTVADLSLTTKPLALMQMKLAYQYRDANNKTPRATYLYASRDGAQGPLNGATNRTNAPMSTTEQKFLVDADYEVAPRTTVRGLVEHTQTDYTLSDVKQTKTNKAAVDLRRIFSDEVTGNFGYAFTQRTGSTYDKNVYFRETYTPTFVAGGTGLLTNHPSMRPFMFNDFDENRLRSSGNWIATETLTFGASVDGFERQYRGNDCNRSFAPTNFVLPDTCLGTRKSLGGSANLDLQWQPDEDLYGFAFLTHGISQTKIDQRNWSNKAAGVAAGDLNDRNRNWFGEMTSTDDTVGFGARWQMTPKWELGGQYVFSVGKGKTEIDLAVPNASTLPDTKSEVQNVNLYAKWAYSYKLTFRLNYLYERAKVTDWAYDNFTPLSNANILLTGQLSPKYENHVVGASVAISTW
jgi:MtrB/PioB family decaheme-associated outer membrane protein